MGKTLKIFFKLRKKNHLNKSITELIVDKDKIINNSKEFLKIQETFYRDLFTSSNNIIDKDSKYFEYLDNLPKLNIELKDKIDEEIKMEDLEKVIKSSKKNSNEFLKYFQSELKFAILKAYKESEKSGYFFQQHNTKINYLYSKSW